MKKVFTLLLALSLATGFVAAQNYTFTPVAPCPLGIYAGASFSINNDVYVVSGVIANQANNPKNMTSTVWDYNTLTNTWTQKNNFPGTAVYGASGFNIDSLGYVVGGWDSTGSASGPNATWQYNPASDTWTQMADFGGSTRYDCGSFVINGIAYLVAGFKPYASDMWAFNPVANTWTQKASLPGVPREAPIAFSMGNFGYAGMGAAYNTFTAGSFNPSDLYKYNPDSDTWTQLNYFPGNPLSASYIFNIYDQVFLVSGLVEQDQTVINGASAAVWRYSPSTDQWFLWGQFPDTALFEGSYAIVNNTGYMGHGASNWFTYPITAKFWRFGPGIAPYNCTAGINALYVNGGERNFEVTGNFSPGAIFSWNFGDSTTDYGASVYHIFGAAGTYVVTLSVTDTAGGGCSTTATDTVNISGISNCSVTIGSTNFGNEYTLSATPVGDGPFLYTWSSPGNPGYYNAVPDPFVWVAANTPTTFCLTITDTTGCQASACDTVTFVDTVATSCQTYLYVAPDPNYPGDYDCYVFFTGSNPVSYLWSFGDGGTSSQQYPTHQYPTPGFYDICLTITDSSGCTSTFCDSAFYAFKVGGGAMQLLNTASGVGHGVTAGIQQTKQSAAFGLYPDPATNLVYITGLTGNIGHAIIYNVEGSKVNEMLAPVNNMIDVHQLAPGMYIIEFTSGENTGVVRFVKMN